MLNAFSMKDELIELIWVIEVVTYLARDTRCETCAAAVIVVSLSRRKAREELASIKVVGLDTVSDIA